MFEPQFFNNRQMEFTCVLVLCSAVVGALAQSFDSGFGLNGFNNLGRCDNEFELHTRVIETPQIRIPNFVTPPIVQQNYINAIVRPQIRKEIITIPRFFQTTSNPILQTIPFVESRNIQIPAFSLNTPKIFTQVPTPIDSRKPVISENALNMGSGRSLGGLNRNFQRLITGTFLGNSLGPASDNIGSSLSGIASSDFVGSNGLVLPRSSVGSGGFANLELTNGC